MNSKNIRSRSAGAAPGTRATSDRREGSKDEPVKQTGSRIVKITSVKKNCMLKANQNIIITYEQAGLEDCSAGP